MFNFMGGIIQEDNINGGYGDDILIGLSGNDTLTTNISTPKETEVT